MGNESVLALMSEQQARNMRLIRQVEASERENRELRMEISRLQESKTVEVGKAKEQICQLRSDLEERERTLQEVNQKNLLAHAELLRISQSWEDERAVNTRLRSLLETKEEVPKPKENDFAMSNLKLKNKQLREENKKLKREAEMHLSELQSQGQTITELMKSHDSKDPQFEAELTRRTEEIVEARKTVRNLQEQLDKSIKIIDTIKSSIPGTGSVLDRIKTMTTQRTQSEEEERMRRTRHQEAVDRLIHEKETLANESAERQLTILRLTDRIKQFEETRADLSSSISGLETMHQMKIGECERNIQQLKTQCTNLQARNQELEQSVRLVSRKLEIEREKRSKSEQKASQVTAILNAELAQREERQKSLEASLNEAKKLARSQKDSLIRENSQLKSTIAQMKEESESLQMELLMSNKRSDILQQTQSDLSHATLDLDALKSELASTRSESADLKQKILEASCRERSVESKIEAKDIVIKKLTQRLKNAEELIQTTEQNKTDESALIADLKQRLYQETTQRTQLEANISELRESIKKLESSYSAEVDKGNNLQAQLTEAKCELAATQEKMRNLTKVLSDSKSHITELRDSNASMNNSIRDIQQKTVPVEELTTAKVEFKKQILQLKSKKHQLKHQVQQLAEKCKQLTNTNEKAEEEIARLKQSIDSFSIENDELQSKSAETIEGLEAQLAEAKSDLTKVLRKLRMHKKQERQLSESQTENEKAQKLNEKLQSQLKEAENARALLERQLRDLEVQLNTIIETRNNEQKNSQSTLDEFLRQTSASRQSVINLQREKDQLNRKIIKLEAEIENLHAELRGTVSKDEADKLRQQLKALMDSQTVENSRVLLSNYTQRQVMEAEIDTLKARENELSKALTNARNEIERKKRQINAIQEEVKNLMEQIKISQDHEVPMCPRSSLEKVQNKCTQMKRRMNELMEQLGQKKNIEAELSTIRESGSRLVNLTKSKSFLRANNSERLRMLAEELEWVFGFTPELDRPPEFTLSENPKLTVDPNSSFQEERTTLANIRRALLKLDFIDIGKEDEDEDIGTQLNNILQIINIITQHVEQLEKDTRTPKEDLDSRHRTAAVLTENSMRFSRSSR